MTLTTSTVDGLIFLVASLFVLNVSGPVADAQYMCSKAGEADCSDISAQYQRITGLEDTRPPSGKYHLMVGEGKRRVWAYCDMDTTGGGWTIIQRRSGPKADFYRTWKEYSEGFGDPDGDYWLGNTYLHSMTVNKRYVLRIDFTDWENKTYYAEYSNFIVGGEGCEYTLESLGKFCGDCGDAMTNPHLGMKFSTKDNKNDKGNANCAKTYHGAWWYNNCHASNLNGDYKIGGIHSTYADGINWYTGKGPYYSYKKSEMKIRPYKY